jgi:Plavaka transposase
MSILMAWIADLKEQYDIVGLASNSCLRCIAKFEDLGNPEPCSCRTGQSILDDLCQIRVDYPSANTWQFVNKVKELGLAGVEELCWEGQSVDIC